MEEQQVDLRNRVGRGPPGATAAGAHLCCRREKVPLSGSNALPMRLQEPGTHISLFLGESQVGNCRGVWRQTFLVSFNLAN